MMMEHILFDARSASWPPAADSVSDTTARAGWAGEGASMADNDQSREASRRGLSRPGALAGLRVLDLTDDLGRFATKLLAEGGASVVKLVGWGSPGRPMADPRAAALGGLCDWWFDGGKTTVDRRHRRVERTGGAARPGRVRRSGDR